MATTTRGGWAKRLTDAYELSFSDHRRLAIVSWETAEGTSARYNPLATTLRVSGSTDFNSVGVQDYPSLSVGVQATKRTLAGQGFGYGAIVLALQENASAKEILEAVAASAWGTGWLALQVLPFVKANYENFADRPIGQ